MVAPESLIIDRGNWQLSPPAAAAVPASAKPTPPSTDVAAEPALEPAPRVTQPPASPSPSWEELVRAGKYPAAYDEASRHGISQLAATRSSNTLLALAEVCRFSGHPAEATQVLTRLRARFPASDDAATAAFQLGRFATDTAAVSWFRTYLKERPNGALAPEASGRLLEALSRSGDRSGAERAAESYLARYPTGQHAAFARQLLGR
jgi:TolA-binding protein